MLRLMIALTFISMAVSSAYMAKCYHDAKLQQEQQTVILQQMYDKMAEGDAVFRSWGDYKEED